MIRRSYRDTDAYIRSNRPLLDKDFRPTGREIFPLAFVDRPVDRKQKDKAA